jgi:hypothetical protein
MHYQIAIGSILMILTVIVHAGFTRAAAEAFAGSHKERWHLQTGWGQVIATATLVLMMFFASLLEASIWAGAYTAIGAISSLEEALYFSIVTFTTLGYGDVTLHVGWRLLGSFEAANGSIMFGWTTALIVALVHTAFNPTRAADPRD